MQSSFAANDLRIETLDVISEVIGPADTRELLQSLVESMETSLSEMRRAEVDGDFTALARAAHRLAGGCGSLGAQQLQETLRRLEKAALEEAGTQCHLMLAKLPMMVSRLRLAVADYSSAEAMAN
jgi:HPt (histidine-containing phosphotransfer) domain-containing protein